MTLFRTQAAVAILAALAVVVSRYVGIPQIGGWRPPRRWSSP